MTRLVFTACLAGLLAIPALADDPKLPGPKIDWPDVKGFTRSKTTVFPEVRLGYSVGYSAPGLTATAYVYNNGRNEIPAGAKSDAVKAEMKANAETLELARKQGLYKSVTEVGAEEVIPLGKGKDAPAALRRKFELDNPKSGPRLSETYLTGYKDHFVKLRVSYAPDDKVEAQKKLATLLEALGAALQ